MKHQVILWRWTSFKCCFGIIDFTDHNNTASFKFKQKITGQTGNDESKDVGILVPLKYPISFWRTVEMQLINCEINLIQHLQ